MRTNLFKIITFIVSFCFVCGFSDIKQPDEYTCGPACAVNCVLNILNNKADIQKLLGYFTRIAKTDVNGTKANNLIKALDVYLQTYNIKSDIKYYGIRRVEKKYKVQTPLNVCDELKNGRSVILNLGFYKIEDNKYIRTGGHYVTACECKGNSVYIADPYVKMEGLYPIRLEKVSGIKIKNPRDDEKYSNTKFEYYKILPVLKYQNSNEEILLNGIISIFPHYL